jgi:hypothetical protein
MGLNNQQPSRLMVGNVDFQVTGREDEHDTYLS